MSMQQDKLSNYYIEQDPNKLDIPDYIDCPEYVTNRKAGYGLQLIGWFIWIGLLLPIVSVLLWIYQAFVIHQHVIVQPVHDQLYSLQFIGGAILLMILGLLLWAGYNWLRFHDKERRRFVDNTHTDEFADFFNVETSDLKQMKRGKVMILFYDDMGELKDYQVQR